MAGNANRQILLKSRPEGPPGLDNFELTEGPIPEPGEGEVLMRVLYLSLDPYMRGRMSAAQSYAKPAAVGQPMVGGTVGEIVKSRNPKFSPGDTVVGHGGWQEYALSSGTGLRKLDPAAAPVSTALGVLGMPGMTAYVGLGEIGQPKAGETVVVAAASGAVGSVVGQIAKIKGARAVGIAGGRRNAASSPRSSASTPASIIAQATLRNSSPPRVPRASTSISRMSAVPCSIRSGRCSTISPAFPCAG
jgi:NADPH-dependent curcumin reductase